MKSFQNKISKIRVVAKRRVLVAYAKWPCCKKVQFVTKCASCLSMNAQ